MTNWRVYALTIADQQQHIEKSEQLLNSIQPGVRPTLYWSLAEPTGLVLGFSQKPAIVNQAELAKEPISIYHRRAGGTAVLVGPGLLSLDVVLPADDPRVLADIVESYRWLGEAWVKVLGKLGIEARCISPGEAHEQRARLRQLETHPYEALMRRACYGALSPYEVVVGQRKVIGLDMIRRRAGSLLQAGVLLHWDTTRLAQLLGQNEKEQALLRQGLKERAVGLDTLLGRVVEHEEVIATFESVVSSLALA